MNKLLFFVYTLTIPIITCVFLGFVFVASQATAHDNCNFPSAIKETTKDRNIENGNVLFTEHCARCHALEQGKDLAATTLTNEGMFAIINFGGYALNRSPSMPTYDFLGRKNIEDIVGYIRHIQSLDEK
jgi:mono/diheme cytochrome c family protein